MSTILWKLPPALPPLVSVEAELPAGMIDHVAAGLGRLCQQFKDKQNIVDLITIFLQRYNDLEAALWALLVERGIDVAVGAQLDQIGKIVGQTRDGLVDDDYRRFIRARIAADRSDGVIEDLITVSRLVLNDAGALIVIDNEGDAGVAVRILQITVDDAVANVLLEFLDVAKSGGVHLILETQPALDADTFFTAIAADGVGALSIGATTIPVNSTVGFPSSGSLDVDTALATAETVTYTGITATSFLGVAALAHNHDDRALIALNGTPGKGCGDTSDGSVGGQLASARDVAYTP